MNRSRFTWIVVGLAGVAAAVPGSLVLVARSPMPSSAPLVSTHTTLESHDERPINITWSVNPLEVVLSPGETASRSVTLISTRNIGGLRLCVSATMRPFVQVAVSTTRETDGGDDPHDDAELDLDADRNTQGCDSKEFELKAGQPLSVVVAFSIPASTALGPYDGTIEISHGNQALQQAMRVVVNIWQQFTDAALDIGFKYPPQLSLSRPDNSPSDVILQSSAQPLCWSGAAPDPPEACATVGYAVVISTRPITVTSQPFAEWLALNFPTLTVRDIRGSKSSGLPGFFVTFSGEASAHGPMVFVPRLGTMFIFGYGSAGLSDAAEDSALSVFFNLITSTKFN